MGVTGNLCSFKGYIHEILIKYKKKKSNFTEEKPGRYHF